jgi:hypothetical protein
MKNFIVILLSILSFYSCKNSVSENPVGSDTTSNVEEKLSDSKILTADGFYFAKKNESGVEEVDPPVYNRGDLVYFVVRNVGNFASDNSGEAHFEMHMKVENSLGENVIIKRDVLKTKGIKKLKGDRINLPNARFQTSENDKPGTYRFFIVLEDKLSNDSITVAGDFFIE